MRNPGEESRSDNRIIIRNLVIPFEIGVNPEEQGRAQRVRFTVILGMAPRGPYRTDDIADTVSYADVVSGIEQLSAEGHFQLVEVVAERVADLCLIDRRVAWVTVLVEKIDIFPHAESVGIEITRSRPEGIP